MDKSVIFEPVLLVNFKTIDLGDEKPLDDKNPTALSEELAVTGREVQKNFIIYSLRILRENLMLSLDQLKNRLVFLTGEEATFSGNFHPFINHDNIYPLTEEFNLVFSHVEANGNPKIIFLDLALKVTRLIR